MPVSTQVSGKHVLVTGGNKGIGHAIAKAFLAEGANVSYCGRSARDDEFANFKGASDGARAVGSKVDLSDHEATKAWIESAAKEFGRIDMVVPNATPALDTNTPEHWRASFETDVLGLVTLIEAAVPHLEKHPGTSSIVIISSLAGWEAKYRELTGPYPVFKRAQAHIGKGYSKTLASKGIRVNTIIPGPIATPNSILPDGTEELSTYNKVKSENPQFMEQIQAMVPMGRAGKAEEVANAVLFLASPLASFTTGSSLVSDGGLSDAYY